MGSFPKSKNCEYILVAVDYVSKWVEAIPCRTTDSKHAKRMFHEVIFPHFGVPWMVISDGGSHFIDKVFWKYLAEHEFITTSQSHTIPRLVARQKYQTSKSRIFCKIPSMKWVRDGRTNSLMHFGHTKLHTRHPLACHLINLYTEKHVIFLLNWSSRLIGQSRNETWIST
jgi:hypothetical protein